MNPSLIPALLLTSFASAHAAVLYSENFDQANGNYVGSPEVQVSPIPIFESWGAVQTVAANQMSTTVGAPGSSSAGHGGFRFGGQTDRFNWALGDIGSAIASAGGFTVSFNWTESGLTGDR